MNDFIGSFEEYVAKLCPHTRQSDALHYAARGEEFLMAVLEDTEIGSTCPIEIGFCIVWCLLKKAYDNKMSFGKGMFLIEFENDAKAVKLNKLLQLLSQKPSYPRISSHFNDRSARWQNGIDYDHNSAVTIPYKFKTLCFGLNVEANSNNALFIKPETQGTNIFKDPVGSLLHGINYLKHKFIGTHKIEGTASFRETGASRAAVLRDFNQKGNEIRFLVTKQGVAIKGANDLFNSALQQLQTLPTFSIQRSKDKEFVNICTEYLEVYIDNIQKESLIFRKTRGKRKQSAEKFVRQRHQELYEINTELSRIAIADDLYDLARKLMDKREFYAKSEPPMIFSNISPWACDYKKESSNFEKLKSVVNTPANTRPVLAG